MLNPVEIGDVIRHLGYPALAVNRSATASPGQVRNYVINTTLYQLQDRLKELDASDEAKLSGACVGVITLTGQDPSVGNSVSVVISGSSDFVGSQTLTATASARNTKFDLASALVSDLVGNQTLVGAGFIPGGAFQGESVLNPNQNPSFILRAPDPFTLSATSSGLTTAFASLQGSRVYPYATVSKNPNGSANIIYGYIPMLNYLESAIAGVSGNADVAKAGDYVRGRELRERKELQEIWKNKLSAFLGVPRFSRAVLEAY